MADFVRENRGGILQTPVTFSKKVCLCLDYRGKGKGTNSISSREERAYRLMVMGNNGMIVLYLAQDAVFCCECLRHDIVASVSICVLAPLIAEMVKGWHL